MSNLLSSNFSLRLLWLWGCCVALPNSSFGCLGSPLKPRNRPSLPTRPSGPPVVMYSNSPSKGKDGNVVRDEAHNIGVAGDEAVLSYKSSVNAPEQNAFEKAGRDNVFLPRSSSKMARSSAEKFPRSSSDDTRRSSNSGSSSGGSRSRSSSLGSTTDISSSCAQCAGTTTDIGSECGAACELGSPTSPRMSPRMSPRTRQVASASGPVSVSCEASLLRNRPYFNANSDIFWPQEHAKEPQHFEEIGGRCPAGDCRHIYELSNICGSDPDHKDPDDGTLLLPDMNVSCCDRQIAEYLAPHAAARWLLLARRGAPRKAFRGASSGSKSCGNDSCEATGDDVHRHCEEKKAILREKISAHLRPVVEPLLLHHLEKKIGYQQPHTQSAYSPREDSSCHGVNCEHFTKLSTSKNWARIFGRGGLNAAETILQRRRLWAALADFLECEYTLKLLFSPSLSLDWWKEIDALTLLDSNSRNGGPKKSMHGEPKRRPETTDARGTQFRKREEENITFEQVLAPPGPRRSFLSHKASFGSIKMNIQEDDNSSSPDGSQDCRLSAKQLGSSSSSNISVLFQRAVLDLWLDTLELHAKIFPGYLLISRGSSSTTSSNRLLGCTSRAATTFNARPQEGGLLSGERASRSDFNTLADLTNHHSHLRGGEVRSGASRHLSGGAGPGAVRSVGALSSCMLFHATRALARVFISRQNVLSVGENQPHAARRSCCSRCPGVRIDFPERQLVCFCGKTLLERLGAAFPDDLAGARVEKTLSFLAARGCTLAKHLLGEHCVIPVNECS